MMIKKIWLSAATAAAVCASAWLGATPSQAQTGELPQPAATAIPLDASAAEESAARAVAPAAVRTVSWSPVSGYLRPDSGRNVTVTAASGDGLDHEYARVTFYDSVDFPVLAVSATVAATSSVSGIDVMTLTVALPTSPTYSTFAFSVKEAGSIKPSGKYKAGFPTYVPETLSTFDWPPVNLDRIEPNNDNQCTIGAPLVTGKTYNGSFKAVTDADWQYIDVVTATTMLITATNVPTPSQVQVFVVPDGKCSSVNGGTLTAFTANQSDPVVTLTGLTGGRVYVRVVANLIAATAQRYSLRLAPNPTSGTFEDNDNPCQATPTAAGTTYTTQIDDTYDFFELKVTQTGTLSMTVFNHANAGQLDLRSPVTDTNCNAATSTRRLTYQYIYNDVANIQYFVTPGTYYARMYIANVPTTTKNYNFVWSVTPGSVPAAPAKVCVGDVSNKTCFGDAPGGVVPVWWEGLNGNARVRLIFSAMTVKGCPTPGKLPTMEFTTTAVNGSRTLSASDNGDWALDQGAYKVVIQVSDASSGGSLPGGNSEGQAVKVNCTFTRPADEQEPAP